MNKTDLIEKLAQKSSLTKKDIGIVVDGVFTEMAVALKKKDDVRIAGFGTFEVRKVKARKAINPATGEKMAIKAYKKPAFRCSKALKDMMN